ncbi:MAG: acyl-CoA dehydrogenase family protein, partial [Pseudomonadota bacterium]
MREPDPVTAVLNQTVLADSGNAVDADAALLDAVEACGAGWALPELRRAAASFGADTMREHAVLANRHSPELATHDRVGRRIEAVDFHPSWHALLGLAVEHGLVSRSWEGRQRGEHVARAALMYLFAQTEAGTQCPVSMSHAVIPVLRRHQGTVPEIAGQWLPKLVSRQYDPRDVPVADKRGVLFGMGMTERQGGSDVRGNITVAEPLDTAGAGRRYRVRGHKWFLSAPMCDAFLVVAQTELGIGCFLVPRRTADGEINGLKLQRLKDKLGNRSNASSEVEFHDALGTLIGEPGAGIATIIEMATYTRLDCQLATAGMQRRALTLALRHAAQRHAFGGPLLEKPLMRAVLADLAVEAEAATLLSLRTAHYFDDSDDPRGAALARLVTAAGKFHVCKRGALFAAETMEVFGGNGYVEELELARIFR